MKMHVRLFSPAPVGAAPVNPGAFFFGCDPMIDPQWLMLAAVALWALCRTVCDG